MSAQPSVLRTTSAAPGRATVSILSLVLAVCAAVSFGMVGAIFSVVLFAVPLLLAAWLVRRRSPWWLLLAGVPRRARGVGCHLPRQSPAGHGLRGLGLRRECGGVALALLAAVVRAVTVRP